MVDQLSFPSQQTIGLLPVLRGLSRLRELLRRLAPGMAQRLRARSSCDVAGTTQPE